MPKTKDIKFIERRKRIIRLLVGYQASEKISDEHAARMMRRSLNTYKSRLENPENFTLGEMWEMLDSLHVPSDKRMELLQ